MRDLKTDLRYLGENPSTTRLMELAEEAVNRVLVAEAEIIFLDKIIKNWTEEWHREHDYLMTKVEENDLQRASIQQLSAQVVGMQRVVEAAKELLAVLCTGYGCSVSEPHTLEKCERWCNAKEKYILKQALADLEGDRL